MALIKPMKFLSICETVSLFHERSLLKSVKAFHTPYVGMTNIKEPVHCRLIGASLFRIRAISNLQRARRSMNTLQVS